MLLTPLMVNDVLFYSTRDTMATEKRNRDLFCKRVFFMEVENVHDYWNKQQ